MPSENPKPPPPPTLSRLAGESLIETIDGPTEIVKLTGKVMPVTTRLDDGSMGFRMMIHIREVEADAELVRLTNADGQNLTVGVDHIFVAADGSDVRAGDLQAGSLLEPGWSYPAGYEVPDAPEYADHIRGKAFPNAVRITACSEAGRGPVYGATVKQTAAYFLTFGAKSRAQIKN
ncbi:MAG: hypothetical protein ABGY42_02815 [bacterium]